MRIHEEKFRFRKGFGNKAVLQIHEFTWRDATPEEGQDFLHAMQGAQDFLSTIHGGYNPEASAYRRIVDLLRAQADLWLYDRLMLFGRMRGN